MNSDTSAWDAWQDGLPFDDGQLWQEMSDDALLVMLDHNPRQPVRLANHTLPASKLTKGLLGESS